MLRDHLLSVGGAAHVVVGTPAGAPVDVPVDLTRAQAQRLAELELSDPAYRAAQPSLIQRAITWLVEWVQRVADRAAEAAPGGWLGILGLVLLIVVAVLFIRWRIGPVSRAAGLTFTVDPGTSASEYRTHADELASAGLWDQAVSERMRALVRASQERGLIDAHPGWTADEVATAVGLRVPDARACLDVAARTFDEVRYGGRPGSPTAYRSIADADDRVAAGTVVGSLGPALVDPALVGPALVDPAPDQPAPDDRTVAP
jgi:hypothetical protein